MITQHSLGRQKILPKKIIVVNKKSKTTYHRRKTLETKRFRESAHENVAIG